VNAPAECGHCHVRRPRRPKRRASATAVDVSGRAAILIGVIRAVTHEPAAKSGNKGAQQFDLLAGNFGALRRQTGNCATRSGKAFHQIGRVGCYRKHNWVFGAARFAASRAGGDGPSVPRRCVARCNKGGNPPYYLGLSQQGRVTLIRHDDDFKLAAPCHHLIQCGSGQHI
jgi:hypothetical protein